MKYKLITKWFSLLLVLMATSVTSALAQSLTISDFQIKAGNTKDVYIELNSDAPIYGVQTDIVLSEGLSIESAATEVQNFSLSKNEKEYVIHDVPTKATRVALLSLGGDAMSAGNVIKLTIKAADTFTSGTILLANTHLTTNSNTGDEVEPEDATANVTLEQSEQWVWRDIKADLTQLQALAIQSDVYITVSATDGSISQTDNANIAAATLKGKWHGTAYGWSNFTASVRVPGCVKITYATHDFGNDIVVTNDAGEEVAKLNTQGAKWSSNHDNVVVAYYRTNTATTLHFSNANYNPYFAVEQIDPSDLPPEVTTYKVTFAAGDGTGVAPAAQEVDAGTAITLPKNYTLYKELSTLTGWSDGTTTYEPGASFTPAADVTLTAVYTKNDVDLSDRTEAVTITYDLSGYNDNPKYKFEGNTGIMVTQATVNGKTIDVKVDVDATSGKFAHNGSGWHQVNTSTKVTVPSCKGATIAVTTYNDATSVKFNGGTDGVVTSGNTATYTATAADATALIEQASSNYWNKLVVTLPVEQQQTDNYYVVFGNDEWTIRAANKLTLNTAATTEEYMLTGVNLGGQQDMFKVVKSNDGKNIDQWYPAGTGNAYGENGEITAYGQYTIYFRPQGDGTTDWFHGVIYVAASEPEPENPYEDKTATWDFTNPTVVAEVVALTGSTGSGTVKAVEDNGILLTVEPHGQTIRDNNGNSIQTGDGVVFKVPVKSTRDIVKVVGYPSLFAYSVGGVDAIEATTEYKAKASDVTQGYVEVVNKGQYIISISVIQKSKYQEKALYSTDFNSDWTEQSESATPVVVTKTTRYSNETLNFSLYQTKVLNVEDTKFSAYTDLPHMALRAEKNLGSWVTTSALAQITKVRYIHGATGGSRGWKLEAKGDGDADWVVISDSYASPNAWCEVEKEINKTNCQLRWTNLADSQNAFMFELDIFGMVDLSQSPILGTFKANGTEYVAGDIFEIDGEGNYTATIELPKDQTMISTDNPLTDVVADNGEIGTITYVGSGTRCTVTIPVTANGQTANYVVTFIQKQDFTLTYYDTDGTEMGTQVVEKDAAIGQFAVDYTTAKAESGYKVRGWFVNADGGRKYTTADVVTSNLKLYAVATEIEVASTTARYTYTLNDQYFYAEDHECFIPEGNGVYHDAQHGWVFGNGDKIKVPVGGDANLILGLCQYSAGKAITVTTEAGAAVGTIANDKASSDGAASMVSYKGDATTLVITFSGTSYLHNLTVANIAGNPVESKGQWYFVAAGDAVSLLNTLDAANASNAAASAERVFIYLPNGTYDLGTAVLTCISGNNISLIGESMEGVIIKNAPKKENEGIGTTATLYNLGSNNYFQDLTIQNALDYYGALSAGQAGGRAVCLWDKGTNTICKNVTMLSYQDTYYSNNNNMKAYWEDCDIHGTVDFICGGGDIRFVNTTLTLEKRQADGKGGRTITAPTTTTSFGYVFDGCKVVDLAGGVGDWNFGRTWQESPICIYLNTTLDDVAKNSLISSRWTQKGMNNKDPKKFGEYNTMDASGANITPTSNKITSYGGEFETILTAAEAEAFAYDKMFTTWDPQTLATQFETTASMQDGVITWTAVDNAVGYAIYDNGDLMDIVDGSTTSYNTAANAQPAPSLESNSTAYTIRVANVMGGLGEPKDVTIITGISKLNLENNGELKIYDLNGRRVMNPGQGVYIINGKKVVIK